MTVTSPRVSSASTTNAWVLENPGCGRVAPSLPTVPKMARSSGAGQHRAGELRSQVAGHPPPAEVAAQREREADHRVQVRPGHRTHGQDHRHHQQSRRGDAATRPMPPWFRRPATAAPAPTMTSRNVPNSSANSRRHSWHRSVKSRAQGGCALQQLGDPDAVPAPQCRCRTERSAGWRRSPGSPGGVG